MTMRHGIHPGLEAAADALLKQSLRGVTKYSDKADILTPWKADMRRRREILVAGGVADPAVRQGMYNRCINAARPDLNSRDGMAANRTNRSTLQSFVTDNGFAPEWMG